MSKYLGLLRWSLNYHDGTKDNVKPMDEDRRKWLMEAMESQIIDPVEQMKNILEVLKIPAPLVDDDDYFTKQAEAIEQIMDYVDNIDLARDFQKLGGVEVALDLLKVSKRERTNSLLLELISRLSQNHPHNQDAIVEKQGLETILSFLTSPSASSGVKAKAIGAVGSIVRGNTSATNKFLVQHKGLPILLQMIENNMKLEKTSDVIRLIRKGLFLVLYLVDTESNVRKPLEYTHYSKFKAYEQEIDDIDSKDILSKIVEILEKAKNGESHSDMSENVQLLKNE